MVIAPSPQAWLEQLAEEAESTPVEGPSAPSAPLGDDRAALEAALAKREVAWSAAAQSVEELAGGLVVPLEDSELVVGPFACLQQPSAHWPIAQLAQKPMVMVACESDCTFWIDTSGKIFADNGVDGEFHPAGDSFAEFLATRLK